MGARCLPLLSLKHRGSSAWGGFWLVVSHGLRRLHSGISLPQGKLQSGVTVGAFCGLCTGIPRLHAGVSLSCARFRRKRGLLMGNTAWALAPSAIKIPQLELTWGQDSSCLSHSPAKPTHPRARGLRGQAEAAGFERCSVLRFQPLRTLVLGTTNCPAQVVAAVHMGVGVGDGRGCSCTVVPWAMPTLYSS